MHRRRLRMMSFFARTFLLLVAIVMLITPAVAQNPGNANMEILAEKLKADKKLVVAMNMELTDAEAKKFWPLYEAYQVQLQVVNEEINRIIGEYANAFNKGSVPNPLAKKLIEAVLKNEVQEMKLKIANYKAVESVLPAVKVARYMQIESKIRAIEKFGIASEVPLIY